MIVSVKFSSNLVIKNQHGTIRDECSDAGQRSEQAGCVADVNAGRSKGRGTVTVAASGVLTDSLQVCSRTACR